MPKNWRNPWTRSTRRRLSTMLCVLSVSLILPLLTAFWWGKLVAFFGATFFLASDGVLCDMLFVKKAEPTKQNFVVMLTYILAQVLLAVGFAACP